MRQIAEFIAVLMCALFTGAAVYITFVEHPARMECGVEIAATQFAPSYRRGTVMQATCAALGLLASFAAWLAGASFWWRIAGVLLGSVIPFTLIAILPTNKRWLPGTASRRDSPVPGPSGVSKANARSDWPEGLSCCGYSIRIQSLGRSVTLEDLETA
jgi:anthrone oxygenase-like protein